MNKFGKMNLQNYSIKTSQADKDLLYIFNRAKKTHASNLGKVANYEYYRHIKEYHLLWTLVNI